jgi:DNA-binding SARP family transcriptional activator
MTRAGAEIGFPRKQRDRFVSLTGYFLTHAGKPMHIEDIIAEVWPDERDSIERADYYRTIGELRKTLEPYLPSKRESNILVSGNRSGVYRFRVRKEDRTDVALLDEAARLVSRPLSADILEQVEAAIRGYRGEFLMEIHGEQWLTQPREHYHHQYIQVLRAAVRWYRRVRDWDRLAEYASAGFSSAPFEDEFCAAEMQLADQSNNLMLVREVYSRYCEAIRSEIDGHPSPEISALHSKLIMH